MSSGKAAFIPVLGGAIAIGLVAGVGSIALDQRGRSMLSARATSAAVAVGLQRRRLPQPGDSWGGCNDARAAGSAPIYRGEPGYRDDMDGDGDGIACEPHR